MKTFLICLVNTFLWKRPFAADILDPIAAILVLMLLFSHPVVFPVQTLLGLKEVATNGSDGNISLRRTDTRDLLCISGSAGGMEAVSLTLLTGQFLFCHFAKEIQMSSRFQLLPPLPH